ncbi:DUF1156 domain-containing protein [Coleofasciculus sp. E1-EBD-02]|uniref:DUF1156 domain-containing protein n=1 Tax=Coleofasciculus sp. E1-EBD-02 TaxID=3068481 RepID=UPI0032FE4BF1
MPTHPKRLIEVDLPIKRISAHARREKSIRHGHISTLHIWWARRPLAACRAVICAALWLDPVDELCPQRFREDATAIINNFAQKAARDLAKTCATETWKRWQVLAKPENQLDAKNPQHLNILRHRLLDFIADFANWDNSTQPDYLETSRALTQAAHEALGGIEGTKPLVVDPFAGGGAIPLEALRVGADAFASDLNPVAVLLNKVVLEYIPKYGQQLADEVRKWGQWVKEEAEKELAEFYPKDPDGATPIAYLWARTITCEGPGCGAEVPLMRSLWLAKKKNRSIALQIIPNSEHKRVDFTIIQNVKAKDVGDGTVKRGSATYPCCGFTTPVASVRKQLKVRNGGADDARLFCVVTTRQKEKGRFYRLPTEKDLEVVGKARDELETRKQEHQGELSLVPDEPLPPQGALGFRVQLYGMEQWGNLFTSRQSLALITLVRLINDVGEKLADGEDQGLAIAVQTVLSIGVSKIADLVNSLVTWQITMDRIRNLFTRQAIPMAWDFAETSPVSNAAGDYSVTIKNVLEVLDRESTIAYPVASIEKSSAANPPLPDNFAQGFFSDPPYCLLPGTLILTDKGYKPIETIQIGEKVLSHQGRFVPVSRLYQRPYQGNIQKLSITGINSPLYITPEHPVYGIHTADCPYAFKYCRPTCSYLAQQGHCKHQKFETYQATWIPASKIQPYDLIGFPILQTTLKPQDLKLSEIFTPDNYTLDGNQLFYEKINPKTLAVRQKLQTLEPKRGALMELARELKVRPNLVYRLNQELNASKSPLHLQTNIIKVDNHLLKLLGYFVADGYANLRNDGGTVNFTFALQQDYLGQEVTKLMERVFGLKPGKSTNNQYANNRSIRYNFYSKPVAEFFRNLCYADDGYKIVPSWVLYLPQNLLWSFIEGLWNGDGYRSSQKYSLTNVSPYLIGQTQIILNKLGIMTKLYRETKSRSNSVNGKTVKGKGRFSLDILGASLLELADNIGLPKTENIERQFTSQQGFFKNGFIWRPIRKVETIAYTGMVYNL